MTQIQLNDAAQRAHASRHTLIARRNEFSLGWCTAYVRWGRIYVVRDARNP